MSQQTASCHYGELVQSIIRLPGVNQGKTCLLFFPPSCYLSNLQAQLLVYFYRVRVKCDAHNIIATFYCSGVIPTLKKPLWVTISVSCLDCHAILCSSGTCFGQETHANTIDRKKDFILVRQNSGMKEALLYVGTCGHKGSFNYLSIKKYEYLSHCHRFSYSNYIHFSMAMNVITSYSLLLCSLHHNIHSLLSKLLYGILIKLVIGIYLIYCMIYNKVFKSIYLKF